MWGGSSSGPSLPGSVRTRSLFLHAPLGPAKSPEAPLLPWVIFSACSSSSPAGAPFLSALFLVLICGGPSPRFCLSPLGGRGKRTGPLPHGCVVCNFCHYRPKLASLSVLRLQKGKRSQDPLPGLGHCRHCVEGWRLRESRGHTVSASQGCVATLLPRAGWAAGELAVCLLVIVEIVFSCRRSGVKDCVCAPGQGEPRELP